VHRHTVAFWIKQFDSGGVNRLLVDAPRSGRPRRYDPEMVSEILAAYNHPETKKPRISPLVEKYKVSRHAIWRWSKRLTK